MLTLLINATTTGWLVMKLGLSKQSDIEKSILCSLTERLNRNVDEPNLVPVTKASGTCSGTGRVTIRTCE